MRYIILSLITTVIFSAEYKQEILININDKEYKLMDGSRVSDGANIISAKLSKVKKFKGSNYTFNIPSHFAYEPDETDKECVSYTFDGKNVVFDVYEINSEISGDDFINAVIDEMNTTLKVKKKAIIPAEDINILGKRVGGKKTNIPLGGFIQRKSFYSFNCGKQKIVIGIQNSDDEKDVEESNELKKLISETFLEIK